MRDYRFFSGLNMQQFKYFVFFLISLSLLGASAHGKSLDRIVAIVNDSVITQTALTKNLARVRTNMRKSHLQIPEEASLKHQVLDNLINTNLQLQLAKKVGIEVDNQRLNDALRDIAKRNKLSLSDLKTKVEKGGAKYREYRENVRNEMIMSQLQQREVARHITITNQQIASFLQSSQQEQLGNTQYHLKNIVVPLPEDPTPKVIEAAKQIANSIVKQIKTGKKFSTVSLSDSIDTAALEGGDMGWKKFAELPEVYDKHLSDLKAGDVAGPIRAANGFHIIKLVAVKGLPKHHTVKQTLVRHILLTPDSITTDRETKDTLNNYRQQINKGKKFEDIARAKSKDLNSASKGGSLGWMTAGTLTPPFEKTMNALKVGQLSKPIKTQYGWHLIQVLKRRNVDDTKAFKKKHVRDLLYRRKFEEGLEQWMHELRSTAFIKIKQ